VGLQSKPYRHPKRGLDVEGGTGVLARRERGEQAILYMRDRTVYTTNPREILREVKTANYYPPERK